MKCANGYITPYSCLLVMHVLKTIVHDTLHRRASWYWSIKTPFFFLTGLPSSSQSS